MQKNRSLITVFCLLCLITVFAGCGGSKYSDAREIMTDHAAIMERYITGLEQAKSGDEVADTINAYTDGMKELLPKISAYREKYPELADVKAPPPAELKKEMARIRDLSGRMQAATMHMMKFMTDPKVQQAMQRMGKELHEASG